MIILKKIMSSFICENNRNVIFEILKNFDITNYNDVKILIKISTICKLLQTMINHILKDLISFYKNRENFYLLGHKEAIKIGDIKIFKYLESRFGLLERYISNSEIHLMCKLGRYAFLECLNMDHYTIILAISWLIQYNHYDYIIKIHADKYMKDSLINDSIISSNNIKFFKLFNINDFCNEDLYVTIINDKYEILEYIIPIYLKSHSSLPNYLCNSKSIKIFKFLWELNPNPNHLNNTLYIVMILNEDICDFILNLMDKYDISLNLKDFENRLYNIVYNMRDEYRSKYIKNASKFIDIKQANDILYKTIQNINDIYYLESCQYPINILDIIKICYPNCERLDINIEVLDYCLNKNPKLIEYMRNIFYKTTYKISDIKYLRYLGTFFKPAKKELKKILINFKKYGYTY